jgi:ribosomal protein S18 acetylase RimI-like enzyme
MPVSVGVLSWKDLETAEFDSRRPREVRRLARAMLKGTGLPDAVIVALRRGRGRIVAVSDRRGPIGLFPFAIGADGTAQVGEPFIHPRASADAGRALTAFAHSIAPRCENMILVLEQPSALLQRALAEADFLTGPRFVEMVRAIAREPRDIPGRWVTYRRCERAFFIRVFRETLPGSLDAPHLPVCRNGTRLMRSFEERGTSEAEDFAVLTVDDKPAGIVILVKEDGAMEILYLGVVPSMRRRGFGALLMKRALSRAHARAADRVTAYVDSDNRPALALYWSFAFSEKRAVSSYYAPAENF